MQDERLTVPLERARGQTLNFCIGIEKFWWSAKNHLNKRVMAQASELSADRFHELVLDSVNSPATQKVQKI